MTEQVAENKEETKSHRLGCMAWLVGETEGGVGALLENLLKLFKFI